MRLWLKRMFGGFALAIAVALTSGAAYQSFATHRDLTQTPPPGKLVDIGGYRLHMWCMGSGEPTVILESGLGGGAFTWPRVQPEVATFTQVCSYDRAGLGYSDNSPGPRTGDQIAQELGKLIQNGGIREKVILVGASSGGFDTRILASKYPERVAALVLVDASHEKQNERLAAVGLAEPVPPLLRFVAMNSRFGFLRLRNETLGLKLEDADPSVRDYVRATVHRSSRYQILYDEATHFDESAQQVAASRRKLDIPVVVVTAGASIGRGDDIHRELQQDLLTLSNSTCQIIAARSQHEVAREQPEAVIDGIRSVLDAVKEKNGPRCLSRN